MSNLIWDWWFGDEPLHHPSPALSPAGVGARRNLRRWFSWVSEATSRRRFFLFLALAGSGTALAPSWVMATEPGREMNLAPAALDYDSSSTFAMILASEDAGEENERIDITPETERASQESRDEDDQRRQRLRELLGGDEEPAPMPDEDTDKTPPDGMQQYKEDKAADRSEEGAFAEPFIEERLPEIDAGRFVLPPVRAVSIDQQPIGNGRVPEALNAGEELLLAALPEDGYDRLALTGGGAWPALCRPWAAPNTYSHPLYFEDRMLERHGHERWGCFQPLASGTRFFATLPMLPYLATVQEPCDIVYSKGYYRAGSPVPKLWQRPPRERRAILVEAAVVSGAFIALP